MKGLSQVGRWGGVAVVGLGALEVVFMVSPFAGFFYASIRFEPLLGFLSHSRLSAWLDGFFLNHSVVTMSAVLEWQREIGLFVFALGLWGFLLSAFQVYGNKLLRRGVATGLLYRISRHPQYLCLGIAGWGLLTIWPRFLLLGFWVTMLFLYAGLARFEERRMEERFGDGYRRFAEPRGAFLPGSPLRRLFEASFGKLRPRAAGWVAAYVFCLVLAFTLGFGLRAYTQSQAAILSELAQGTVVVSVWPKAAAWMSRVVSAARASEEVAQRLEEAGEHPVVATILPSDYGMDGMYYKLTAESGARLRLESLSVERAAGLAFAWLVPRRGWAWGENPLLGVDPDRSAGPVRVVFSRAEKPYKEALTLEEALDASVRLTPLVVASVEPRTGRVAAVRVPLLQNIWGRNVVMPLF